MGSIYIADGELDNARSHIRKFQENMEEYLRTVKQLSDNVSELNKLGNSLKSAQDLLQSQAEARSQLSDIALGATELFNVIAGIVSDVSEGEGYANFLGELN